MSTVTAGLTLAGEEWIAEPASGTPCYDRAAPADAQALLDAHHPPSPAWGRLVLWWVSGDAWQPINRWVIMQCQHAQFVPAVLLEELRGPHPRWRTQLTYRPRIVAGRRQLRPHVTREGEGLPPKGMLSREQWECAQALRESTGEWWLPRWFWVVQGTHGGHPFGLDQYTERLWRLLTKTPDVPSMGDLAYAPMDRRVIERMTYWDLWRHTKGGDAPSQALARRLARHAAAESDANAALWRQFEDESAEWADEFQFAARQDGLHRLRVGAPSTIAAPLDEQRERFIYPSEAAA